MSGRELPKGWELVDFDALVASAQNGLSKRQGDEGKAVPVLRLADFDGRQIAPKEPREILMSNRERNELSLRQGDLLCVRVNGSENIVGRFGIFHQEGEWSFCDHFIRYRLNSAALSEYVGRFFETDLARHHIESSFVSSAGQKTVNRGIVGSTQVPLAPLPEQRRIVEKIEALTARSRRAREALDSLPALIDRYRQSILAAAFRGDLTAKWRQRHQSVDAKAAKAALLDERQRVWAERRQRRYSPPSTLEFDDLAPLPAEWFWATADECTWELTVGHVGPMKDRYVASGIPFLRSQNVRENRFDRKELRFIPEDFHRELGKSVLRPGDVVVVRSGAPGVACAIPDELSEANCADLVICRLLPSFLPSLLAYYINSAPARRMIFGMQVGVAQQHFNVGAMARLPVPVIPPGEQEVLLAFLDRAFQSIAEMEKRLILQEDCLTTLDRSILAKAFRGELVPQDPNDEPASVLLERIRTERAAAGDTPRRGRRPRAAGG